MSVRPMKQFTLHGLAIIEIQPPFPNRDVFPILTRVGVKQIQGMSLEDPGDRTVGVSRIGEPAKLKISIAFSLTQLQTGHQLKNNHKSHCQTRMGKSTMFLVSFLH